MLKSTKAHQAAPAPESPTAPQSQPDSPLAAPEPAARPETTTAPDGQQKGTERPEGAILRLVPLGFEVDEGATLDAKGVLHVRLEADVLGPDYPTGTVLGFQSGEPAEPGSIALARLSTGVVVVGTIEGGRFALPGEGGQTITFAIPEPAVRYVVPCIVAIVDMRGRTGARATVGK